MVLALPFCLTFLILPEIGQPCPAVPRVAGSTCYNIYAVCEGGRLVGYNIVANSDWSPYYWDVNPFALMVLVNLLMVPQGVSGDRPGGLGGVLAGYYLQYASASFPLPFMSGAPVIIMELVMPFIVPALFPLGIVIQQWMIILVFVVIGKQGMQDVIISLLMIVESGIILMTLVMFVVVMFKFIM
jgi:hypothetical protein